jgi:WD40 repeat protein
MEKVIIQLDSIQAMNTASTDPAALTALNAPPSDGISSMAFAPEGLGGASSDDMLLVASWDSTVRLYNVTKNLPKHTFNTDSANLW